MKSSLPQEDISSSSHCNLFSPNPNLRRLIQPKGIRLKSFVFRTPFHTYHDKQVYVTIIVAFVIAIPRSNPPTSLYMFVIACLQVLFILLLGISLS